MRWFSVFFLASLLVGCSKDEPAPIDTDPSADDTDDTDSTVDTDDTDPCDETAWYTDGDADGFGDDATEVMACDAPSGAVAVGGDCDDADDSAFPGGVEVCDGADNDCDGSVDPDDSQGAATWYLDGDGDGYGVDDTLVACDAPVGYAPADGDCDDADPTMNPGEIDDCNDRDDDCDGAVDSDVPTWFRDADLDGYGDPADSVVECTAPSGYVSAGGDCADADPDVNPGADELCDGAVDEDCDGTVDEDAAADAPTWYADADEDGYGDASSTYAACELPSGYAANDDDCDDGAAGTNPAALEYCGGADEDCDGSIDEDSAADATVWHADADKDTYGSATATRAACAMPSGYVANATDCDDARALTNPAASEYCNTYDDDCDGTTDESSAVDAETWYDDDDADAYGDVADTTKACAAPAGYVADATDCDDARALSNPGATEYCNTYDDDCDGTKDEDSAADAKTWYVDADSDGYGASATTKKACSAPTGYVATSTDCNDARALTNPGASEYCNTFDDDCDGTIDEDSAVDAPTWYYDADLDAYGTSSVTKKACTSPSGYVAKGTDCDDADGYTYPAALELCDGKRNDCDITAWTSADEDLTVSVLDSSGDWTNVTDDVILEYTYTLPTTGTVYFCDGEYLVHVEGTVASGGLTMVGRNGSAATIINAATYGPALMVSSVVGKLTIQGLTFTNGSGWNNPSDSSLETLGGAAYVRGDVTLEDVVFDGSTATYGGGLYATDVTATDVAFSDNVATSNGGGLFLLGRLVCVGCSFTGNNATTYGGGAYGTSAASFATSDFSTNVAGTWGGAVALILTASHTVTATDSTFDGNEATRGGGWYVSSGTALPTLSFDNVTIDSNVASDRGGGVYLDTDGYVSFDASSVSGNDSGVSGGGIYLLGSGTLDITSTAVDLNTALTQGGGLYFSYGADVTALSSSFSGNTIVSSSTTASLEGGGVYGSNGTLSMTSSTVDGNYLSPTAKSAHGGGLYLQNVTTTLTSSTVSNNDAYNGAGMYLMDGTDLTMTSSIVKNNDAAFRGGGAFVDTYISYGLVCNGSTSVTAGFTGNYAYSSGGGVFVSRNFDSNSCDFGTTSLNNNTISTGSSDVSAGGTTYNYGSDATFACTSSSCL